MSSVPTRAFVRCSGAVARTRPAFLESTPSQEVAPGVVIVAGGKYTTYRATAEEAVDAAVRTLGARQSSTRDLPLVGAHDLDVVRAAVSARLGGSLADQLLCRYGTETLSLVGDSDEAPAYIEAGEGYLVGEPTWSCQVEGAMHLDDVMRRRARLATETIDRGVAAARPVAEEMARALGWDAARRDAEVASYLRGIEGERAAETAADDPAALKAYSAID